MVDSDDLIDGLTKIGAYDYQFPRPSKIVVEAWLEHFEQYPALTRDDLLEAIKVYYRKPDVSPPKPADVSHLARELRRDRNSRWTDDDMDRFEALCDSKAAPDDDGLLVAIAAAIPATEDERRRAIESFALSRKNTLSAAPKRTETVQELVARQRAAAPARPIMGDEFLRPGFNSDAPESES